MSAMASLIGDQHFWHSHSLSLLLLWLYNLRMLLPVATLFISSQSMTKIHLSGSNVSKFTLLEAMSVSIPHGRVLLIIKFLVHISMLSFTCQWLSWACPHYPHFGVEYGMLGDKMAVVFQSES